MTLTFRIIAGVFGAVGTILFKYEHNTLGLICVLLAIASLFVALFTNKSESQPKHHTEAQKSLFLTALKTIKYRAGITLAQINELEVVFEENKRCLPKRQEQTIRSLISHLKDVRIDDSELEGIRDRDKRKPFVTSRRKSITEVENIEKTIDKYLRKIT